MLSEGFITKMKAKLEEEKVQVESKIKAFSADEIPVNDNPDWDDIGNDATEDIVEEKIVEAHKNILEKINKALGKIEEKTYGKCEKTEVTIPEEHLELVPWAEFCKDATTTNKQN